MHVHVPHVASAKRALSQQCFRPTTVTGTGGDSACWTACSRTACSAAYQCPTCIVGNSDPQHQVQSRCRHQHNKACPNGLWVCPLQTSMQSPQYQHNISVPQCMAAAEINSISLPTAATPEKVALIIVSLMQCQLLDETHSCEAANPTDTHVIVCCCSSGRTTAEVAIQDRTVVEHERTVAHHCGATAAIQ